MNEIKGWAAVPAALERRMRDRKITKSQIVRKHGVDWGTMAKLQNGEPVREDACWRVAASLGWRGDAFDRIREGLEPIEDDGSETPTGSSDLRDLLGVGGQVVQDELDEIKARLDALEGDGSAKVTPLNPRQRSRKADPGYRVDTAHAASQDSGEPAEKRPTGRPATRPSPPDEGPDPTVFND